MILSIVNEAILPVWLLWVLGGSIGSILVALFCGLSSLDYRLRQMRKLNE